MIVGTPLLVGSSGDSGPVAEVPFCAVHIDQVARLHAVVHIGVYMREQWAK